MVASQEQQDDGVTDSHAPNLHLEGCIDFVRTNRSRPRRASRSCTLGRQPSLYREWQLKPIKNLF